MSGQAAQAKKDYSFLDEKDVQEQYTTDDANRRIRFLVSGVRCANCLRKIESLVGNHNGLTDLRFEMGSSLAHVQIDPEVTSFSKVADAIVDQGFDVTPIGKSSDTEKAEITAARQELIRLGVAGACAGNIMGFAFAAYFGLQPEWQPAFGWLSFVLYLPVVSYVAVPFYRGALRGLRQRQLSIDLPMAVASLGGFVFSTVQLIRGQSDIYYDSLSGFLFLILVSRWLQRRLQTQALKDSRFYRELFSVRKIVGGHWRWTMADALQSGDQVIVEGGETVAFDGRLLEPKAHFSLAWLSGEAKPRSFTSGAEIPAGAKLLSATAQMAFVKPLKETTFGKIISEAREFALHKNAAILASDRWAQHLLRTVFAIAAIFLVSYWHISPDEAIRRTLALIVIACPCAMAFGTPLAIAFPMRRATKLGLLIRDANVLARIRSVKTVFFDKTGTLTESNLQLRPESKKIPQVFQKIILALETPSMHPIAFAFRQAFPVDGKLPPVINYKEEYGKGVSGYVFGKMYSIAKGPATQSDELSCTLFEDDRPLYHFFFNVAVRPDALQTIAALRSRGLDVCLISGDAKDAVQGLARKLGIDPRKAYAGLNPTEKAALISQHPGSLMIGDGVNDAVALAAADVGIAVSGAAGAALRNAPVYLLSENLIVIPELFNLGARSSRTIRQNLALSLIYNTISGTLALLGLINPFVAAVLMPISSGAILINSWMRR